MKKGLKKHATTLAVALCLLGGVVFSAGSATPTADKVYYGGKIYTMTDLLDDSGKPDFSKLKDLTADKAETVEVVATRNGQIIFAGNRVQAESQGYFDAAGQKVDLGGHVMLPGLVDGHGHFPWQGQVDLFSVDLNSPPLGKMNNIADIQAALREQCQAANPGDGVAGANYDDSLLQERRHPTRQELDAACSDKPVRVSHISGHMAVANTRALIDGGVLADENSPGPNADTVGVEKTNGVPNGLLLETTAMGLVSVNVAMDMQQILARGNHVYAAAGVTTADDGLSSVAVNLPMYQAGLGNKNLKLRVLLHPSGYYNQAGANNRRLMGWQSSGETPVDMHLDGSSAVPVGADVTSRNVGQNVPANLPANMVLHGAHKLLFDGSPQGYTAWFKSPGFYDWGAYTKDDSSILDDSLKPSANQFFVGAGSLNITIPQLSLLLDKYQQYGISTETHTNGSAAAEYWVAAMEKAVSDHRGVTDTRHTSIHAQMMELQHLQRLMGNYDAAEQAILSMGSAAPVSGADEASTFGKMYTDLAGAFEGAQYAAANVNGMTKAALGSAMRAQNFLMSYYINHTYFWGDRHKEIFMGPGRANNMSPVGWSIALSQPYSFHNDTTVTPISPLRSVQSAVARTTARSALYPGGTLISGSGQDINATVVRPSRKTNGMELPESNMTYWSYDQRINALQALLGVTFMPAWQNKVEDRIGSIRPGLLADFAILDLDPAQVASAAPQSLADIRVTSTIVGDEVVYGFLPGSRTFAATPMAAYIQNAGVRVSGLTATALNNEEADKIHALQRDETRYGTYDIDAAVSANGAVGVLQMDMLGNNAPVSAFRLYSVANANAPEAFVYGRNLAEGGHFWIAPMDEPKSALAAGDVLTMNKSYVLFYTMEDGGKYDVTRTRAATDGRVTGSVALVTTGSLPTNKTATGGGAGGGDDGSGGCTVGATPSYDLAILLLVLAGVAVLRALRRRKN